MNHEVLVYALNLGHIYQLYNRFGNDILSHPKFPYIGLYCASLSALDLFPLTHPTMFL
jgi:hypothetical protein